MSERELILKNVPFMFRRNALECADQYAAKFLDDGRKEGRGDCVCFFAKGQPTFIGYQTKKAVVIECTSA